MILHDVMVGYNRQTKTYRFYADGREILVKGDMAYHRICLLLANAVEREGNNSGKN